MLGHLLTGSLTPTGWAEHGGRWSDTRAGRGRPFARRDAPDAEGPAHRPDGTHPPTRLAPVREAHIQGGTQMSTVDPASEPATASPPVKPGEMRLEVVVLPVSDVDRAKSFYTGLGWRLDADLVVDAGYSV